MRTKSLARSAVALLAAGILLAGCDGITDPAMLTPPEPRIDPGNGEQPPPTMSSPASTPAGRAGS